MYQMSFLDLPDRLEQLSECGDPLEKLNELVDWKIFFPIINRALSKARKSKAGRKPFNRVMMFKILILQHLLNCMRLDLCKIQWVGNLLKPLELKERSAKSA